MSNFVDPTLMAVQAIPKEDPRENLHRDYWNMRPSHRHCYLTWLADGRRAEDAPIGFPLMFLSGIERRIFVDLKGKISFDEANDLEQELLGLLGAYGHRSAPLLEHGREVIKLVAAVRRPPTLDDLDPVDLAEARKYKTNEAKRTEFVAPFFPLALRLALSHAARTELRISAQHALAVVQMHPYIFLGWGAQYFDEFAQLFLLRFQERYADSFVLTASPSTLLHSYRPVEYELSRISATEELQFDVEFSCSQQDPQLKELEDLTGAVAHELSRYGEHLQREGNAGLGDQVSIRMFLPLELWPELSGRGMQWLEEKVKLHGVHCLSYRDLLALFEADLVDTDLQLDSLLLALKTAGLSLEADWSAQHRPLLWDKQAMVAVFADNSDTVDFMKSVSYRMGLLMLQVAVILHSSEGSGAETLIECIESVISGVPDITVGIAERLRARSGLPIKGIDAKELELRARSFDRSQKAVIADTALRIAATRTLPNRALMKVLEEILSALGREHTKEMPSLADVLAKAKVPVRVIPMRLDEHRVRQLHADSERTLALLLPIFDDKVGAHTEWTKATASPEPHRAAKGLPLDESHAEFASRALQQAQWPRTELSAVAAEYGLMLDGALEQVNGAAQDAWDICFFEGIDPLEVSPEARDKLAGQHVGEDLSQ